MESNLNLELIEKVKSGKAAIEHTLKSKDAAQLRELLSTIFPKDNEELCLGNMKYYYSQLTFEWGSDDELPDDMEAIPLSAFFTNELPKEDKQLIGKIDELLGQLKTISQSVFELREHASLVLPDVAPVEQVEQPKWKEGEFVLDKEKLGYVTQVMADRLLAVNVDGGWAMNVPIESAFNPPKEYVEQHLASIAREKYPVGTVFKSVGYGVRHSVANHNYIEYEKGELLMNGACVWYGGFWATIIKEEVKERWKPAMNEFYYYVSLDNGIHSNKNINKGWGTDQNCLITGNCFKTEEEAQSVATHIKQYLTSLQF